MSTAPNSRKEILAALRQALEGERDSFFKGAVAGQDWLALDQYEKSALLQLQNWEQDKPLRNAFPQHAEYSNKRLQHLISVLD